MRDMQIDRVEVVTLAPPVRRLAWAHDMQGQFMTGTLVRIFVRGGLSGVACAASYADFQYEVSVAEALRGIIPHLIGRDALAREAIWQELLSKTIPRAPQAQSLIDVALWDVAARAAGLPMWRMLGGCRSAIPAYGSTPLLASAEAYVEEVERLRSAGFRAVKFHCWCEPDRDLAMVRRVAASGAAEGLAVMLDVEQRYERQQALRVGRVLGELGYTWFEAPLDDYDLLGYQALTQALSVPIVPGGNAVVDHRLVAAALHLKCWSTVRIDVMNCGGLTPALKIMGIADAHGLRVELQCWGYTLHQAANLALMLGQSNSTYFEQPLPYEAFEFAAQQTIRADRAGMVHAPEGAGLGIELDWNAVAQATLARIDCTERGAIAFGSPQRAGAQPR